MIFSQSVAESGTYIFFFQSNTFPSCFQPFSCCSTVPLTSSSINSFVSSTSFQNSLSWVMIFLNYSSLSNIWSFFPWVWSGLWDNVSTFLWELPGLCISWKSYFCNFVIYWAWWQLSFCSFLKYPKFLWSVHILNWSLPIRYCHHCLSPFIIANNSQS